MPFKVYENTNDDEIEDIDKSILTSIADSMGMLIKESIYVYILQHDELVDKKILKAGYLVTDAEFMSPAMKESLWYVKSGLEPVKVNMNK
eukprot:15346847-Ditylum_brightwellii.AAC.1